MINLNEKVDELVLILNKSELYQFGFINYYAKTFMLNESMTLCSFQKELIYSFFNKEIKQIKTVYEMSNLITKHMEYTIKELKEKLLQHYFEIND